MSFKYPHQIMQHTFAVVAGGVAVAGAGYSLYEGEHKKAMGKKQIAAANAERPMEQTPQAVLDNQALAQQNANTGLPSAQYNVAMQNIKNQQMQALSSSSDRRGGLALVGQIQAQGNNANENLDAANSAQRLKNDSTLMGVNSEVGGYQNKAWENNYNDKYKNDYNYAMGLLGSGNANITSGVDQLGAAGTRIASNYAFRNNNNSINNDNSGGSNGGFGGYNWGAQTTQGGNGSTTDPQMY